MDSDMPNPKNDGGDHGNGRLVPDPQKRERGHRQGRDGHGDGAERLVHAAELLAAPEIPCPGDLVENHEHAGGYQPQDPREREALRADKHDGGGGSEDLADALEHEEGLVLVPGELLVAEGLVLRPPDVGYEQHRQKHDAHYREAEPHLHLPNPVEIHQSILKHGVAPVGTLPNQWSR